ncbi:hypothetical protein [Hyphomicrobium sp.]|uniref:hypothetical protein n=1 Tax=Hyphomicrobium sp. TaxID=82 RepID=UPI002E308840|nr:hypothetical protein [Hyphomicrobium sp.]HEX2843400.1 hypothetical protein [Hyphomicrobium sp.]
MTDDATNFSLLLSGTTLLAALAAFYMGRSIWIARRELPGCRLDTKVLYLLVAPPLTLAVDILQFTDKLLWSNTAPLQALHRKRVAVVPRLRAKSALRS